ncbi:copper resistance D family protein [Metabacillus fastidiosus]|uniref:copper resistance D family protein n=1 Tax=Metabacillus fastidiosus TaxID=1458 RepID=UPI003D29DC2F
MNQIIPISEFFTYVLFSFLAGHIILEFIPEHKKPKIVVPKYQILLAILGIIIFTFFPVLHVILFFSRYDDFFISLVTTITQFETGNAWLFGSFIAVFLWMTIYIEGSKYLKAFFLLLMIIAIGYASHGASLSPLLGLASHSVHFLFITSWVGILLHIAWNSRGEINFKPFLQWFTPFAVISIIIISLTGFLLMGLVVKPADYANSWALPYGQMILLKHLSIIPVIFFAFINGILARKTIKNPISWLQAETIILLLVFFFTGVMGTLAPPHLVNATVLQNGASAWFESLISQTVNPPFTVQIDLSLQGVIFGVLALLFLLLIIGSFIRKASAWLSLLFGFSFIIAMYFCLMFNITV